MAFSDDDVREFHARLFQLGATDCPMCSTSGMWLEKAPAHVFIGDNVQNPSKVLYAVVLRCSLCGHIALFSTETFFEGNERREK